MLILSFFLFFGIYIKKEICKGEHGKDLARLSLKQVWGGRNLSMKPEFILPANDGSSGFSYITELLPSRRAPGMVLLLRVRFCGQQTSSSQGDKCVCMEERGGVNRD